MDYLTRFNSLSIAQPNILEAKPDLRFVRWHREEVFHGPVGSWITGLISTEEPRRIYQL
jgi:hypothetical protein